MRRKTAKPGKLENHLVVFQEKAILRIWHKEEWWFAIVAVVAVLTTRSTRRACQGFTLRQGVGQKVGGKLPPAFGLKPKVVQRVNWN